MRSRIAVVLLVVFLTASLAFAQAPSVPFVKSGTEVPIVVRVSESSMVPPMASTATLTFAWDPQPAGESWQYVRIYERTGTTPNYTYTKLAEVAGTATTATVTGVTIGPHVYIARSYNVFESADSNTVTTPAAPATPTGVRITITIIVTP